MLYPIPTATRELTLLNGIWDLAFDSQHQGFRLRYPEQTPSDTCSIAVPGSINEQLADPTRYHHMDWVWYFRDFIVSPLWLSRRIFLRFGSANYRAEVFLDGERLGAHEGGYTPFEFEITHLVRLGQSHRLVVRLDNLLDATTVPQGNLPPELGGVAAWRIGNHPNVHYDFFPFSGLHRPVVLYATGESRWESARFTTHSVPGHYRPIQCRVDLVRKRRPD